MKHRWTAFLGAFLLIVASQLWAAEHRVEMLSEGPPGEVPQAVAATLSPKGLKVIRGTKRTVCEIWLAKAWPVSADFTPTAQVLYPFEPGQLIGAIHFTGKGHDFRDQEIPEGVYTLRYGQQPVDGNHVGTSPTQDFLVLIRADQDTSPAPIPPKELLKRSATSVESTHPGILCLQKLSGEPDSQPALVHNEERDWWILRLQGAATAGEKQQPLTLDLVVVGTSEG